MNAETRAFACASIPICTKVLFMDAVGGDIVCIDSGFRGSGAILVSRPKPKLNRQMFGSYKI
jgi:hypothetical protein